MTTTTTRASAADRQAALDEAHASIISAVEAITSAEDWKRWMDIAKGFHTYSFNNMLLIHIQASMRNMAPITRCAGFKHWLTLNRGVRKGEKGLKIYAPIIVKIPEGERGFPGTKVVGFRLTTTFDLQQTDGEPLPEPKQATGTIAGRVAPGALTALGEYATALGFPWRYGDTGPAEGYTMGVPVNEIVISDRLRDNEAQTFAVLTHEIGHASLHMSDETGIYDYRAHRGVAETEAESIAYLVAGFFGVDMSDTAFHYVAGWAKDPEVVVTAGTRIMRVAKKIIDMVEKAIEQ